MTIGIYALYWEEQGLIYIGQSLNIEGREKDHISSLKRDDHFNSKVQDAYYKYGLPKLLILEETSGAELNNKEVYWIKKTNAQLNTAIGGGSGGKGIGHSQFKFTKLQVLIAFRQLSSSYKFLLNREISANTGITIGMLEAISSGKNHVWLKENYPIRHSRMLTLRALRAKYNNSNRKSIKEYCTNIGKALPVVISPEGLEFTVSNIREFARNHNLPHSSLNYVVNGKRKACQGWILKTT